MNLLLNSITHYITTKNLIPDGSKIVVGLSGGPDSVFLLHVLAQLADQKNLSLIAAHLDHGWRPESPRDAQFCQELAATLHIPFVKAQLPELGTIFKANGSKEELGRKARRYFFEKVKQEHDADLIALAHHAQDQQETFFIRLARGTSLSGLSAIRPKHGAYIRPLLYLNKPDLLAYLHSNKIPYLVDTSNESQEYLRNRIRSTVLPALHNADDRFDKNFAATVERLQETEHFLDKLTSKTFAEITQIGENQIWLNITAFNNLDPILQDRIVVHWLCVMRVPFTVSQKFINEIKRFVSHKTNKGEHTLHPCWKIIKINDFATINSYSTLTP